MSEGAMLDQDRRGTREPAMEPQRVHQTSGEAETKEERTIMSLAQTLIEELREQRNQLLHERSEAAVERRGNTRWKRFLQFLFFGGPLVLGGLYFTVFLFSTGLRLGPMPWRDVVGVVRIEGPVLPGKPASAERVIDALTSAFGSASTKAVVLAIDSPGGAPAEAERIYRAIESLRKKHAKPVVAVIENVGTSAAYLIAIHADRIVAGKYSLVGSIGALMEGWQLDKALARVDVSQRLYTSGKLKGFMNPFTPSTPEADAKAVQVVRRVGGTFLAEVRTARGDQLKPNIDYGTGEVWVGEEAKQIGLVDSVGTIEEVVDSSWGLKMFNFGPDVSPTNLFSEAMGGVAQNVVERLIGMGAVSLR